MAAPELRHPFVAALATARIEAWARYALVIFALLLAVLVALVAVQNQYGTRVAAGIMQAVGAVDLVNSVPRRPDPAEAAVAVDPATHKYVAIGDYLARRYRISAQVATDIVAQAYRSAAQFHLDPMLILAVISVESRFNPIAESPMGAKGLMQIIPKFHTDKFNELGGVNAAFEPGANIWVGASILRDCLRRAGDIAAALQLYVGASSDESENGYSDKVLGERDRLNEVLRNYQINVRNAQHSAPRVRQDAV
jgi:soluble lytic murein transglycosylase-like protein